MCVGGGMEDFEKTKQKIRKQFAQREGFSDEILDAITASYIFLQEKYPQKIEESQIPDVKDFKFASIDGKRTLANIYVNRIFNNVKRVEFGRVEGAEDISEYSSVFKLVRIGIDIDQRLFAWKNTIKNEQQKQCIAKQIRAKIIVHEFLHAASDNGFVTGFIGGSDAAKHIKDNPNLYSGVDSLGVSQLEEAITEILSLEIVGNHILTDKSKSEGMLVCRNADSSNYKINPFAEYFYRIYPDCVEGKFTDGLLWLSKFDQKFLKNWGIDHEGHCRNTKFNEYLLEIVNSKPRINPFLSLACFQEYMLLDYLSNLNIQNKDQLVKEVKNFAAFSVFAVKDSTGKEYGDLQERLNDVKSNILKESTKLGVEKEELNTILMSEYNRLRSKNENGLVFSEPYSHILLESKQGAIE